MSRLGRPFLCDRYIFVTVAYLALILAVPQGAFAWGREGHQIIVILAEYYMRPETTARMGELLAPESPEEASAWADEYRHDHRETGPLPPYGRESCFPGSVPLPGGGSGS